MQAPPTLRTRRLLLRRPEPGDAHTIFTRYASDEAVTRYLGWRRHTTEEETWAFLSFAADEWRRWGAGPYLIVGRDDGVLLGSTGLAFETPYRASTGYVLARDAWGHGFATEALLAMTELAESLGVRRLYALCEAGHEASRRVLEKGGFDAEARLARYLVFPNLDDPEPRDVLCYTRLLPAPR